MERQCPSTGLGTIAFFRERTRCRSRCCMTSALSSRRGSWRCWSLVTEASRRAGARCRRRGVFAEVVRIGHGIRHRFARAARLAGIETVGIKVFKSGNDGKAEGKKAVRFHCEDRLALGDLGGAAVQRSLTAEHRNGGYYAVVEWIDGEVLDVVLERTMPDGLGHALLEQLFGSKIIPLWSRGLIFWDVRAANFCWDSRSARLVLIDVDSLADCGQEVLRPSSDWSRREKWRRTALRRLRSLTLRIVQGAGHRETRVACKDAVYRFWATHLEPVLATLRAPCARPTAETGHAAFVHELQSGGFLALE